VKHVGLTTEFLIFSVVKKSDEEKEFLTSDFFDIILFYDDTLIFGAFLTCFL